MLFRSHYNKLLYFLISLLLFCWSDTGVACGLSSVLSGGKILNTNEVGTLNAGYDLTYTYQGSTGHKFQLANVRDVNYRTEGTPTDSTNINNGHKYEYDLNGNLVYINTSRVKRDGKEDEKATEQKFKWDEENRLLAADENGFVSNYWYDADGERTVKTSGEGEQIYVNSKFAGGRTNTAKFSLYVSPYLVANQGGRYTKHIYIGSQRIVSKLGGFASYGSDPRRIAYAGSEADAVSVDYKGKYASQQQVIKDNYATFNVPYNGEDNNDYVDGEGFCCNDGSMEAAQAKAMAANAAGAKAISGNFKENDDYEKMQFYYHPDHLGSSSYITNLDGEVAQHIEYVPFGEVFIEERNNTWNTPYLFNAKEFDEETGMYYYGARYYEPRVSLWISTDPLEDDYPMFTSYCFVNNNPLIFIDPKGMDSYYTMDGVYLGDDKKKTQYVFAVRNEDYRFDKKSGYNLIYRKTQLRNNKNEAITKDEFNNLAGTLFAESTPGKNNSWKEAAAIYSVLENRGNADNKTTLEIASGGGIYGYNERDKIFNAKAPKNHVKNAYKGLIRGILDEYDYSNGGYYWHGSDFHMKDRPAYKSFYKTGFKFSSPSHDIWKMGNYKTNSKWAYKYESTAAYGNTTFMHLSTLWQKENHTNHWDGTYKKK